MGGDLHPLILRALGDHSNLARKEASEKWFLPCYRSFLRLYPIALLNVLIIAAAVTFQLCHVLFMSYLCFIQLFWLSSFVMFYSMLYIRYRNQRWKIPEVGGGSHGGSHLCDPPAEHHDRCRLAVAVPPFWDLQRQFVVAWNGDFPRFLGENHGPKGICVGVMFFFWREEFLLNLSTDTRSIDVLSWR